MSNPSLLAALDNINELKNLQLGENLHPEYKWAENIKELIVQYFYQIAENGSNNIDKLKETYISLIMSSLNLSKIHPEKNIYLNSLYKLIAQTRDIVAGKGLYNITYMMISCWAKLGLINKNYEELGLKLAEDAIENLVKGSNKQPLGSWKDIKYFCNYWKEELGIAGAPTVEDYNVLNKDRIFLKTKHLVKEQLDKDIFGVNNLNPSLLAKWIPRETSKKFGWLTPILAEYYYAHFLTSAKTEYQESKARRKCLTKFRITITEINKKLKTTQIYQCSRNWKEINFDKNVTSITLRKQGLAFQNRKKNSKTREYADSFIREDREECANNYQQYILDCSKGKKIIKAKNISIIDLVRAADNINDSNEIECLALNTQWNEQCKETSDLNNMIAMVDTSGSMETDNCNPLYSAIGLGLRVAEKSTFGKRVLTFSNNPEWVNLDNCKTFVDSVKKIRRAPWGMNTNFMAALDLILNTAIASEITPESLGQTTLVIFSDMQIDLAINPYNYSPHETSNNNSSLNTLFDNIKIKYEEAGKRSIFKKAYPVPHIIFWNLRSTNGFPNLSQTKNTSMLSGSSGNLLNLFIDKGPKILDELTPWKLLQECLENIRYNDFDILKKNLI